jgi:DDE superfamily endonuclease
MSLPIICASTLLCQFLEAFRPLFSKPQWKYFETVLLGLLQCDERHTMTAWLRVIRSGRSLCGMSRVLRHAPWSAEAVGAAWLRQFHQEGLPVVQAEHARQRQTQPRRRGRPKRTRVTGALILDDSVHVKPRGEVMRGLGRHYSSGEHKVVTGHNLFQALYVVLGRQCPLAPQMYRTRAACERDGEHFFSKIALAVRTIQTFTPISTTHTVVLADSWYVCKAVWTAAKARGFIVTGGLKCNRKLRLVATDGTRSWQRIDAYAAALPESGWTSVIWPTDGGGLTVEAHLVRTLIHRVGACQLLCVRHGSSLRYFVTSDLTASLEQVMRWVALRWEIETFFEDLKDVLGTDHYQVLHNRAILRIWTLACCVYRFLATIQATHDSLVSIGQCRRSIRDEHRHLFLRWLQQQFADGWSPDALASYLAS